MKMGSTMSVLMISGRADFGGGPEHVYQLTKALGKRAQVYVACPREEPYWSRYEELLGPEFMFEIPHRRFSFPVLRQLAHFVKQTEIDLLHAHGRAAGIYGRLAAWMAGKRCCYTPHGGTPIKSLKTLIYAGIEYFFSFGTDRVIAVSPTEGQSLRPLCARRGQLVVIPNGVEVPATQPLREIVPDAALRIIHATRFVYQKNSELLVRILENLRATGELWRFQFEILGDGPGRAAFEEKLRTRQLDAFVTLHGAVSNPGDYLLAADGFISTSRWEGLPLVVLEAMARGVPVIASNVVGNRDAVVHGDTGLLYDLDAPEQAARALVQLADDLYLRTWFSNSAWLRALNQFSVGAMAGSTLEIYQKLSEAEARPRSAAPVLSPSQPQPEPLKA